MLTVLLVLLINPADNHVTAESFIFPTLLECNAAADQLEVVVANERPDLHMRAACIDHRYISREVFDRNN